MAKATDLRDLRRRVKYIASLLSGRGRVYEQMSEVWACAPVERIIFWRETIPFPPFRNASEEELLFFMGHESGHLNFTGGWDEPLDWSLEKSEAYKFFNNFIEDIRIERLMGIDYPGFGRIRPNVSGMALREFWDQIPTDEMPLYQQAGGYWYFKDEHNPKFLPKKFKQFCDDVWPEIDRISNAQSTAEMSVPLVPLFEKLWEEDPQNGGSGNLDSEEFSGLGDGFGDEPSKNPAKSPMGSGQRPLSFEEMIEGISKGMFSPGARQKMNEIMAGESQARVKAGQDKLIATGPHAGTEKGIRQNPDNSWDNAKMRMQPEINALAHRLRTVLKNNEMGNWMEGKRRGRMNTHRAMRAVSGNNRIFRQRTILGSKDYTWGIAVDVSGSMIEPVKTTSTKRNSYYNKADAALCATVLLAESFEKAQMPYFIIPWETTLRDRKGIRERLGRSKDQLGADIHYPSGGTYESPALIVAEEEFAQVISGHRVLFMISDGETSNKDESKHLVQELEEMGVVVIAIGVGIPAPAHHSRKVTVDDAGELVELLPRLVNEFVRKGH